MRTQIQPHEATGRTVEGYHADWTIAIVLLSGNAFMALEAGSWPESDHAHIEHPRQFQWDEHLAFLAKWGLCSVEEESKLCAKFAAEYALKREQQERAEFERLAKKFGGGT